MTFVLVVEDEDSFSDALSYLLRKEGFEVAVWRELLTLIQAVLRR